MQEEPKEEEKKLTPAMKEFAEGDEPLEDKGLLISETWLYKIFVKSAYRFLNKPLALLQLLKQSAERLQRYDSARELGEDVLEQFQLLFRMVRAYAKGEYKGVSLQGVVLSVAALLYFVAPLDFIPDFLVIGLVDDIALILWLIKNYKQELEDFQAWEDAQKIQIEIDPHPIEQEDEGSKEN
ncbi:YkvA family protein [Saprospira sp. CCB-QB6]|uniref:YkvA family protein n=1 Tax=Saprospira sp. CCB-QB6 TaxID=3023936 RepID=UPI00234BCF22|nr:YkvA family protein [Saprospira sp. CCB-QB6]WCL81371.1 YkvA family protein [Saprospira sp. CCB-QB6]